MSEVAEKRKYRATFILDTRNFKDPVESLIERVTTAINSVEGEVVGVKNLGQKDFIRVTDRKFPAGIFVQYEIEGAPEVPANIQEKFRLDKTVDRIVIQSI